ncbi:MAG TPA: hypothetical protein PLN89_05445, partial [Elusimicrobiota bacterium]|nr:hypothetical protein [Elusimicrobiota bacterium]
MNPLGVAVLAALVLVQVIEWTGDALNLRALSPRPPDMFKDLYDADRYARSQEYTRARIRFGFVVQFLELAGVVGFWVAGSVRIHGGGRDGGVRWEVGAEGGGAVEREAGGVRVVRSRRAIEPTMSFSGPAPDGLRGPLRLRFSVW